MEDQNREQHSSQRQKLEVSRLTKPDNDDENITTESQAPGDNVMIINNSSSTYHQGSGSDQYGNYNQLAYPPGYRFRPRDSELIIYYLNRKIMRHPLPVPNVIHDVELYKYNPETLAANYEPNGGTEWYFFTPRDKKYPKGTRPNRAAGDGYWKATGADKAVIFKKVHTVGSKKTLVFYKGKAPNGYKTDWIMHEFKVIDPDSMKTRKANRGMRLDDWVLCRIHDKKNKPSRTRSGIDDDDDDDENEDEPLENIGISAQHGALQNQIPIGGYNHGSQLGYFDRPDVSTIYQNSVEHNALQEQTFIPNVIGNFDHRSQFRYLGDTFSYHQRSQNEISSNPRCWDFPPAQSNLEYYQNPQNELARIFEGKLPANPRSWDIPPEQSNPEYHQNWENELSRISEGELPPRNPQCSVYPGEHSNSGYVLKTTFDPEINHVNDIVQFSLNSQEESIDQLLSLDTYHSSSTSLDYVNDESKA